MKNYDCTSETPFAWDNFLSLTETDALDSRALPGSPLILVALEPARDLGLSTIFLVHLDPATWTEPLVSCGWHTIQLLTAKQLGSSGSWLGDLKKNNVVSSLQLDN